MYSKDNVIIKTTTTTIIIIINIIYGVYYVSLQNLLHIMQAILFQSDHI
jgi:hypothetical protein